MPQYIYYRTDPGLRRRRARTSVLRRGREHWKYLSGKDLYVTESIDAKVD